MSVGELPSYTDVLAEVAAAERADGWLSVCEARGRFLALNREFVDALAAELKGLGAESVLEVCAGDGELAERLSASGVATVATDAAPPPGSSVVQADAREALARYQPTVVLGSFVPFDAEVERIVLATPSVAHYVMLNARIGGQIGAAMLWNTTTWQAQSLPAISRWMVCRHDVWLGGERPLLQHGEAWLFTQAGAR